MADEREPLDEFHDEPLFMAIDANDPAMAEAMDKARQRISRFRDFISSKTDPETVHSAKIRVSVDGRFFFIWVSFVSCEGERFLGRAIQPPREVTFLRPGMFIRFGIEDLWDWMVHENGHLFGGFSMRVMRTLLPERRRASFDSHSGVEVYEPEDA